LGYYSAIGSGLPDFWLVYHGFGCGFAADWVAIWVQVQKFHSRLIFGLLGVVGEYEFSPREYIERNCLCLPDASSTTIYQHLDLNTNLYFTITASSS